MKVPTDDEIENRITHEVVVDSYDGNYALCWHVYLENKLEFPFTAIDKTSTKNIHLKISGLLSEEECEDGMYVYCTIDNDELPIALADLEVIEGTVLIKQAVGDWHYWCAQDYELNDSEFEDDYY